MKVVFVSPYQAEGDVIDYGLHVIRSAPFNVTDTLGAELVKHPHFEEYKFPQADAPTPPESEPERID